MSNTKLGKILVCFKCPDAKYYAVKNYVNSIENDDKIFNCKREEWEYNDIEDCISKKLDKWIKWGEVVTIEVDLDNDTARVCENVGR